jgi:hypothetical protein
VDHDADGFQRQADQHGRIFPGGVTISHLLRGDAARERQDNPQGPCKFGVLEGTAELDRGHIAALLPEMVDLDDREAHTAQHKNRADDLGNVGQRS